jgi:hypothetical protein
LSTEETNSTPQKENSKFSIEVVTDNTTKEKSPSKNDDKLLSSLSPTPSPYRMTHFVTSSEMSTPITENSKLRIDNRNDLSFVSSSALKLKQFVFSNELILTGNAEIDGQIKDAYPRTRLTLKAGGSGAYVPDEIVYQSADATYANSTAQATVHDYVTGSSLDVYRLSGDFTSNGTVRGVTSGAAWAINTESDTATMDNAFEDVIDNNRIEGESDGVIDFTEHNPFGEP